MSDTLGVSTGQDDGDGSEERFAEFYRSEYPGSVRLAFSLIGSIESAEDVVQEMFSRLGTRFLDLDNPGAYLRIGIIHGCQDVWQKRKLAVEPRHDQDYMFKRRVQRNSLTCCSNFRIANAPSWSFGIGRIGPKRTSPTSSDADLVP